MILNALELDFFRNYVHFQSGFDPRVNLIYGENAQGKTNLLEAIAYLSSAKSHRARYDREMIMLDIDGAFLKGSVDSRGRTFTLEAKLHRGKSRQLYSNGVRLKTAGELAGILTTVLFCPEDLYLIREGAAARRKFLDLAICQLRPRYAQALGEYNRLYEHKTRILRDWPDNPSLLQTLDDFMPAHGPDRGSGGALPGPLCEAAPGDRAPPSTGTSPADGRNCPCGMRRCPRSPDPLAPPRSILEEILAHQERHRQAELDARQCLTGPHKDDLAVELDGPVRQDVRLPGADPHRRPLPEAGPAGDLLPGDRGVPPSFCWTTCCLSWTAKRQSFVLNHIQGGQIFITCCEEEKLEGLEQGRSFHIQGGKLI